MSLIIGWKDANIFSDALGKIKKNNKLFLLHLQFVISWYYFDKNS